MVVKLKVGRILPKNWVAQQFRKAGGFFSFQSNMWEMWKSALNSFKKEAEKDYELGNDTLKVTLVKDSEPYKGKILQWQICECTSFDKEREQKCFDRLEIINKQIGKNYDKMKEENDVLVKKQTKKFSELSKKLNMAKHKVEDVINKGLSRDGDRTVNDKMLELDIIIHKTIEDNKEEQNNIN